MDQHAYKTGYRLLKWIKAHPLLNISGLEKAAGIPPRIIHKALKANRYISEKHHNNLENVLYEYGYRKEITYKELLYGKS